MRVYYIHGVQHSTKSQISLYTKINKNILLPSSELSSVSFLDWGSLSLAVDEAVASGAAVASPCFSFSVSSSSDESSSSLDESSLSDPDSLSELASFSTGSVVVVVVVVCSEGTPPIYKQIFHWC